MKRMYIRAATMADGLTAGAADYYLIRDAQGVIPFGRASVLHAALCSLACRVVSSAAFIPSIGDGQEGDARRFQIDTPGGNTPTTQVGKLVV
jgi:hypothetical protein